MVEYMPMEKAVQAPNCRLIGALQLVHARQVEALKGFKQYLRGFRGAAKVRSQPKVAVVNTQSYCLYLGHATDSDAPEAAIQCWVV